MADGLSRLLAHTSAWAYARPWRALAAIAVISAVAFFGVRRLSIDSDLAHLLPKTFASVQDLDKLAERFWGIGYVVVIGRDAEPEALKRFADDIGPELEALPNIRYAETKRPVDYFADRALYFLDLEDLGTVRDRLKARERFERRRRNPMYIDLEDSAPPSVELEDLREKYSQRAERSWLGGQAGDAYYLDPNKRMVLVLAKPAKRATDMTFSREVVGEVQGLVDGLDLSQYGPHFKAELTGRYKKKIDQQAQIEKDLSAASMLALGLMLLYLVVHFRRISAIALVMLPLLVGLWWSFGFAGVLFGTLNLLTGFIGAILMGLGIDHGIHLLQRFEGERAGGHEVPEAIAITFRDTGHAVVIAAVTTTFGFAGLALSEFGVFREFGVTAAVGMLLVVAAYTVLLPALIAIFPWVLRQRPRPVPRSSLAAALPRWAPAVFWLFLLALIGIASKSSDDQFDYDFAALEDGNLPSFRLDREANRLLGYSQTPVLVLTDDEASERAVAKALRARKDEYGERSSVDFVAAVADLIPVQQAEKYEIIREIGRIAKQVKPDTLDEKDRERLEDLKRMTGIPPFARADLPLEVRRQFQGPGSSVEEGFVLIFPRISLGDGQAVRALADEVRGAQLPSGERMPIAGEAMILADILVMVSREAPPVLGFTLVLVFASLWLLLGRLRPAVICMGVALGTLALLLGLLPLVDVKINYLNMVMIPVLFGIAVDGGVHMITRLEQGGDFVERFSETGRGIAGAVLTTVLGFGAMMLADQPGLNSLGRLAALGLASNLLVCLVGLGALLALDARRHARNHGAVDQICTVGLAGFSPVAPGTLGALAALPIAWALSLTPWPVWAAVLIVASGLSIGVVNRYLGADSTADPSEVVVDELVGCLIALAFVPWDPLWVLAAFGLFRLFDIFKPWPVGWIDRRVHRGAGVMGDDIVAGLMAGGILLTVQIYIA